ncbi:MAG: TIGR02301 family protein [Caulobacteraceae bacterium]|nr:TIGR02301 family protein [Caulobacteraceae bacterium]
MRSLTVIVAAAAVLAGAVGAAAQERSPADRQTLMDLAYVLGRSHALRQACAGPADQFWRTRMQRLIDTETPDAAFDGRLETAFNTGFAAAQAAFPRCNAAVRREQVRAAERGRALAATLTGTVAEDDPSR